MTEKVKYTGASQDQINWGGNDDPRNLLVVGETYTVLKREVHSWHTKVYLTRFPNLRFNDVSFEAVKDPTP